MVSRVWVFFGVLFTLKFIFLSHSEILYLDGSRFYNNPVPTAVVTWSQKMKTLVDVIIYGLFNNAASSSAYSESDDRMNNA